MNRTARRTGDQHDKRRIRVTKPTDRPNANRRHRTVNDTFIAEQVTPHNGYGHATADDGRQIVQCTIRSHHSRARIQNHRDKEGKDQP